MAKAEIDTTVQESDTETAKAVITALTDDDGQLSTVVELFHKPEVIGTQSVAYLVFGVPGTPDYSFWDLNNLPDDVTVTVDVIRGEQKLSCNMFVGKTGNNPQAAQQ